MTMSAGIGVGTANEKSPNFLIDAGFSGTAGDALNKMFCQKKLPADLYFPTAPIACVYNALSNGAWNPE